MSDLTLGLDTENESVVTTEEFKVGENDNWTLGDGVDDDTLELGSVDDDTLELGSVDDDTLEDFDDLTLGDFDETEVENLLSDAELVEPKGIEEISKETEEQINPDNLEYLQCETTYNSFLKLSRKYTFSTQFLYYSLYSQRDYLIDQLEKIGNYKNSKRPITKGKELVDYLNAHRNECFTVIVRVIYNQFCLVVADTLQRNGIVNNEYNQFISKLFKSFKKEVAELIKCSHPEIEEEDRFKNVVNTLGEYTDSIVTLALKKLFLPAVINMIKTEFESNTKDSKPLQYFKSVWCPNHPELNQNSVNSYLDWIAKEEWRLGNEFVLRTKDYYEANHLTLNYFLRSISTFQNDFTNSVNHALEGILKDYEEAQEIKFTNKSKKELKLRELLGEVEDKIDVLNQDCIEEFLATEIVLNYQNTIRELRNDFEYVLQPDEMEIPMEDLGLDWEEFCSSKALQESFSQLLRTQPDKSLFNSNVDFVPEITEQSLLKVLKKFGEMSFNQLRRKHAVYPKKIELLENQDAQRIMCPCGAVLREPVHLFRFQYYVSSQTPKVNKDSSYYRDIANPSMLFENNNLLSNYRSIADNKFGNIIGFPNKDQFGEKLSQIPEPYRKFWTSFEICPHCGARIQLPFAMMRLLAAYHANNIIGLTGSGVRISDYHRSCSLVSDNVDTQAIVPTFVDYNPVILRNYYSEFVKNVVQNEGDSSDIDYVLGTLREDSTPSKNKSSLSKYAKRRNESSNRFFSSYLKIVKEEEQKQKEKLVMTEKSKDVLRAISNFNNKGNTEVMQLYLNSIQYQFTEVLKLNQSKKCLGDRIAKYNRFLLYLTNGDDSNKLPIAEFLNRTAEETGEFSTQSLLPRVFLTGMKSLKNFYELIVVYGEIIVLQKQCLREDTNDYEYLDFTPTASLRLIEFFAKRLKATKSALREYRLASAYYVAQRSEFVDSLLKRNLTVEEDAFNYVNSVYDKEIEHIEISVGNITEEKVFFSTIRGERKSLGERIYESKSEGLLVSATERYNDVVLVYNHLYELLEKQLTGMLSLDQKGIKLNQKSLKFSRGVVYRGLSNNIAHCLSTTLLENDAEEVEIVRSLSMGVNEALREEGCTYQVNTSNYKNPRVNKVDEDYFSYLFAYKFLNESIFCGESKVTKGNQTLRAYTTEEIEPMPIIAKQFLNSYALYNSLFYAVDDGVFSGYCHVIKQYLEHDRFKSQDNNNKVLLSSKKITKICRNLGVDINGNIETVLKALLITLVKLCSNQELTPKNRVWECISNEFLESYEDNMVENSKREDVGHPLVFSLQCNYAKEVAKSILIESEDQRRVFLSSCISDPEIDIDKLMLEMDKFIELVNSETGLSFK